MLDLSAQPTKLCGSPIDNLEVQTGRKANREGLHVADHVIGTDPSTFRHVSGRGPSLLTSKAVTVRLVADRPLAAFAGVSFEVDPAIHGKAPPF